MSYPLPSGSVELSYVWGLLEHLLETLIPRAPEILRSWGHPIVEVLRQPLGGAGLGQGVLSQGRRGGGVQGPLVVVVLQRGARQGSVAVAAHVVHLQVGLALRGQQPRDAEGVAGGRVARGLLLQPVVLQRQGAQLLAQAQLGRVQQRQRVVPPLLVAVVLPVAALVRLAYRLLLLVLEPLLAPQEAAVLEHVARVGVQRPEGPLARLVGGARHLHEAVVEGQRVPDGVLPALLVLPVERKQVHDELVDLRQGEHPLRVVLDGHGDEGDVGVGRLGVGVGAAVGLVRPGALQGGGVGRGGVAPQLGAAAAHGAHGGQRGPVAPHAGAHGRRAGVAPGGHARGGHGHAAHGAHAGAVARVSLRGMGGHAAHGVDAVGGGQAGAEREAGAHGEALPVWQLLGQHVGCPQSSAHHSTNTSLPTVAVGWLSLTVARVYRRTLCLDLSQSPVTGRGRPGAGPLRCHGHGPTLLPIGRRGRGGVAARPSPPSPPSPPSAPPPLPATPAPLSRTSRNLSFYPTTTRRYAETGLILRKYISETTR